MASEAEAVYKAFPNGLPEEFMVFVQRLIDEANVPVEFHRSIKTQLIETASVQENFDVKNSNHASMLTKHFNEKLPAMLYRAMDEFFEMTAGQTIAERMSQVEKLRRTVERRSQVDSRYTYIITELYAELKSIFLQDSSIASHHKAGIIDFKRPPKPVKNNQEVLSLKDYLDEQKADYILNMLNEIGVADGLKSKLSEREKSALLGIADALIEKSIVSKKSLHRTTRIIAREFNIDLPAKLANGSEVSADYKQKALDFMDKYPLKRVR